MIGFTFNNVHSRDMGVVFKSDDRTLLPAKRITQYKIPGKSGTYDIADGYDNRQISCTVAFVGAGNAYAGVRQTARAVAEWLSGDGLLIFDDEPEKAYSAKVIDGIGIEQIAVTGHCSVTLLYYCHAYCSCERGTNENINRMIRRRFPKGTDFETVTDADVARVEDWINNYPREILGFQSSAQMFSAAFAAAA